MALTVDLHNNSKPKHLEIMQAIRKEYGNSGWLELAGWMRRHYKAEPYDPNNPELTNIVVTWHYRFSDPALYMEFCLRWM